MINTNSVGKEWGISGAEKDWNWGFWRKKKLYRDAREKQKHWPEAEKRDKGCRAKAQRYKIDLWGEESLGEEDSQGETLARRIHLREE